MKYISEYTWYSSYVDTDMVWLEDAMNWDDVFDLVTSEYNLLLLFSASFFLDSHYFLDWKVKLSFLDRLFMSEAGVNRLTLVLFTALIWDAESLFSTVLMHLPSVFYSDFQDIFTTVSYYSPELILGMRDSISSLWLGQTMKATVAASFDVYRDAAGASHADFMDYLAGFSSFLAYAIALLAIVRVGSLLNSVDSYPTRAYFYLYSLSSEVRFQFEAGLQAFFFVFLYTSMMIATFDDDQEEILEFFNTMCYYFFLSTLVYYFFKYSMHYFSFLEAAKGETRKTSPVSQFLFDALNIVSFSLRFMVLMVRLNIYDGVDDVLDSYYIFGTDFDEEEYFSDMFFSMFSLMVFEIDLNDDRFFLLEDETDLAADLFSLYYLIWGKFAYFWLFILEEIARVALALYVTYLVIFEINAVNRSYSEDNYLATKRSSGL